jgi:hypothetical protein
MKLSAICLLFTCFFFGFIGCHTDSTVNPPDIKGTWREEIYVEGFNTISQLEYDFKEEGVVQILRIEIDKDSKEILGYRHKTTGSYKQSGNKLSFYNLTIYNNDDSKGFYSELQGLIKESEGGSYHITVEVGENGNKLTFIYPSCGELANCIRTQTLIRSM